MRSPAMMMLALSILLPGASSAEDGNEDGRTQETSGVFVEKLEAAPKTETQERAAKALYDRYPDAKMESIGAGTGTRRGYRAAPFMFMGPLGFAQSRFRAEVACAEVSLDGVSPPVFAMFFVSPKEKSGILVIDTPVSAAACAPKRDKRRTREGMKEFREFMESHRAYSKGLFGKIFGD